MSERPSASEHKPFPETRRSVIGAIGDPDFDRRRQAFETLITVYWKPVYTYMRLFKRVDCAAAEDLTQGFFAHAFEKRTLDGYDPARARFRTWLRRCLDAYVANQHKAALRLKRGGAYAHLPLDFENAEGDLRHYDPPASEDLETFFQREWTRALFALAVDELRRESLAGGRGLEFALFERYDLEAPQGDAQPTYAELAREFSISAGKVTNSLHAMRSRLRRKVLSRLRETCGSEAEYRAEARTLFGHDPK